MLILLIVIQHHRAHYSLSLFVNFSYSEKLSPRFYNMLTYLLNSNINIK